MLIICYLTIYFTFSYISIDFIHTYIDIFIIKNRFIEWMIILNIHKIINIKMIFKRNK